MLAMFKKVLTMFKKKPVDINVVKAKKGYNPVFLSKIQPQGGLSFHEAYIRKGDGYETVINVYEYPTNVNLFWLDKLMNMPTVSICQLDIATVDRVETVHVLNRSLKEQRDRIYTEKDPIHSLDARKAAQILERTYNKVSQGGEVIKTIILRLHLCGKTIKDLEATTKLTIANLEALGFRGSIYLNEMEFDWRSLFSPYDEQQKWINHRQGKPMSALTLSAGLPYHYTKLEDPNGSFLGTTFTGGNVMFDNFCKTAKRLSYNALCFGVMGAGKSTLLKKMMLDNVIRGNFVRGIDVTGEFETLVKALGGKMIKLDGSDGIINPLHVLKTNEEDSLSLRDHISKMSMFYRYISPAADTTEIQEFEKILRGLYIEWGLDKKAVGRGANEYPTFSDFLHYTREKLYRDFASKQFRDELSRLKSERLERIELSIENVVDTYGAIFDGYSSIEDVQNEQLVFFSIRSLTGQKKEIFNAQMFNILALLWDNMLQKGSVQKEAFEKGETSWQDITRYMVIIDEAHRLVNGDNLQAVDFLINFSREARKYFGGLLLASQSVRDFVPEGSSSELVNKIKVLFELAQYKFIMKQDSNAIAAMKEIFQGQLNESEIARVPHLKQGECILSITGDQNISFRVEISKREEALFTGGA